MKYNYRRCVLIEERESSEHSQYIIFKEKKVTIKKAICILAQNNIKVDDDGATVILNFLYIVAKSTQLHKVAPDLNNLNRKSNSEKTSLLNNLNENRPNLKLV